MKVIIPPIKSQGIKTKLVPWIEDLIYKSGESLSCNWIEPFFGTGVVGLNSPLHGRHLAGDTNPHIIAFYQGLKEGTIDEFKMRRYLEAEAELLSTADENGYAHYREVRDRFNHEHSPYDFIFLSRSGFNGMMRFNHKGEWNIPFCKKPHRFSPAYITKICNQVAKVRTIVQRKDWIFENVTFDKLISQAGENDLIYCDPPYYGRYVDYYNGWTEEDEALLYRLLAHTKAKFILSTWHHNEFRSNDMIERYWNRFNVMTKEHFYHSGGHIENRHAVVEALVYNFELKPSAKKIVQRSLFETPRATANVVGL